MLWRRKIRTESGNEDALTRPLHCLIADIPQAMLVDIVQRIVEETGNIRVVDRIPDLAELPAALARQPVDVLVVGMEKFKFPQVCSEMLQKFSNLLVVGLIDDGRMAAVYVNDISATEVANIIRILGRR